MEASWMLTRLKAETAMHHASADEERLALLTTTVTPADYREFLLKIYGLEAPIEAAFCLTTELREVIDLRSRTKMRLLKADLLALGVSDTSRIPLCRTVRPFRSVADALGWMYVVERNTLLHGIILRHLEKKLPDTIRSAGSYLTGNERGSGVRWWELGASLDDYARTTGSQDRIITGAHAAFRCQRNWLREQKPQLRVA